MISIGLTFYPEYLKVGSELTLASRRQEPAGLTSAWRGPAPASRPGGQGPGPASADQTPPAPVAYNGRRYYQTVFTKIRKTRSDDQVQ